MALASIPEVTVLGTKHRTILVFPVRLGMRSKAGDVILLKIIISLDLWFFGSSQRTLINIIDIHKF